jgi:glyoxylase-like metal-dependent hydrolase (beta-lactamase superfamily II)
MARRQEQETARSEVSEEAPGILRMQLPISMPGLGHVNCYALLDGEGATIVDPGLPDPLSWKALRARLKQADLAVENVHTVIITHSHPDHFGGAARFAREADARVIAHTHFRFGLADPAAREVPEVSVEDIEADRESKESAESEAKPQPDASQDEFPATKTHAPVRFWGGPTPWGEEGPKPGLRTRLKWRALRMLARSRIIPKITHPVEHGAVLKLAGREWFILHTPGHTEDHICLHDPALGIFLAGDHVLPTITPHISGISTSPDPLQSFFYSLDRVGEISGVTRVLPAHGHPFANLHERADAIKRHHHERLEKIKSISRELGPATVRDISRQLFKPRSWGAMAESETYAHLEHLRHLGEAEHYRDENGKLIYVAG